MHCVEVEEQDFVDLIPKVTRHYEYPFSYHRNSAPLMLIAQKARDEGIKGLLSGEGSDELFASSLARGVPGIGSILAPDRVGNANAVRHLLNSREMADDFELVSDAVAASKGASRDKTVGWTLDYLHYHLRTLLHRNDTMGMAASIEARFPFLDHGVAKFGVNFNNARIADVLELSSRQMRKTVENASPDLQTRLMLADVWVASVLDKEDMDLTTARLRDHVRIRAEGQKPRQPKNAGNRERAPVAPV